MFGSVWWGVRFWECGWWEWEKGDTKQSREYKRLSGTFWWLRVREGGGSWEPGKMECEKGGKGGMQRVREGEVEGGTDTNVPPLNRSAFPSLLPPEVA